MGRFHQPSSAWNTEHHHGRYLQTAITRPTIENWEDEQGLIPQHITGLLLDSRIPVGSVSGVQFSSGVGAGPSLTSDGYEPITIGNNPGKHRLSLTSRLAYLPDDAGISGAGLLWARDQIYLRRFPAAASLPSDHATLGIYGIYADWTVQAWRLIAANYYVDIQIDGLAHHENFISGYVQAERELTPQLTVFGRIEDSARMQTSRYVALFYDHSGDIDIALRRLAGGLRWDFARRQAFTIELSHIVSLNQRAYEGRLQWSAAIP